MDRLRALLLTNPLIVLITTLMGTISLAASLFDKAGNTQHRIARAWSKVILAISGVRVHLQGLEKLDPAGSYVLVANHQSLMDTPVVLAHVPLQFRFFAKNGLFRIPFIGTHLRRAGHLPVVRNDARASLKTMGEGARLISQRRISVLLFPEAGRSPTGLRDFKEGAAYIAIKAGVPVVPIGIEGTRTILPMHSITVRPGDVYLSIGEPISTTGFPIQRRGELTQLLRARVAELSGQVSAAGVT
jgi:1-acyl-sn-glycerol-3-phosphate acyltransferase